NLLECFGNLPVPRSVPHSVRLFHETILLRADLLLTDGSIAGRMRRHSGWSTVRNVSRQGNGDRPGRPAADGPVGGAAADQERSRGTHARDSIVRQPFAAATGAGPGPGWRPGRRLSPQTPSADGGRSICPARRRGDILHGRSE